VSHTEIHQSFQRISAEAQSIKSELQALLSQSAIMALPQPLQDIIAGLVSQTDAIIGMAGVSAKLVKPAPEPEPVIEPEPHKPVKRFRV